MVLTEAWQTPGINGPNGDCPTVDGRCIVGRTALPALSLSLFKAVSDANRIVIYHPIAAGDDSLSFSGASLCRDGLWRVDIEDDDNERWRSLSLVAVGGDEAPAYQLIVTRYLLSSVSDLTAYS